MVQLYVCIYIYFVKHVTPLLGCGSFWPSVHNLNKPGSGELHDTTNQISRLQDWLFQTRFLIIYSKTPEAVPFTATVLLFEQT